MKKILVTGFSGFVSTHFLEYIDTLGIEIQIIGISRNLQKNKQFKNLNYKVLVGDLKNASFVKDVISTTQPDYVLHLASDSSVAYSWEHPLESFQNNTNIFLNLVESVRLSRVKCRILSIGSSEQYGIVNASNLPLTEESPLNPINPYAIARVSQEMLSKIYAKSYGLDIVMTRSFNHIGPNQSDRFVVSSFVKQILLKKYRKTKNEFFVGEVSIIRDFLDVRDVINAYWQLLNNGQTGEVYNICSGIGISLNDIIDKILKITQVNFNYHVSKSLVRPSDNPVIIGSNQKIYSEIGWKPIIPIDQSLQDIIVDWEKKLLI
jgi:GDP-4-dehydro-6-deoxy-D-mannose reductase